MLPFSDIVSFPVDVVSGVFLLATQTEPFGSAELINNLDDGNPLYLQSNDNSGLAIVNVKLVGVENYKMWATAMKIALEGKNKMGFIDGTCVKQDTNVVLSKQ
nr:putative Gag-polypeptide of LTR copia-type [Tanacetum cinerariifolium]